MRELKLYRKQSEDQKIMFFCPDPVSLDKSASWGEGNIQTHTSGCWVQLDDVFEIEPSFTHVSDDSDYIAPKISHLVAGDSNNPVGWTSVGCNNMWWSKNPVYAYQTEETKIELQTLDGTMVYDNNNQDGWVLYNQNQDKSVNYDDSWFMENDKFVGMYQPIY